MFQVRRHIKDLQEIHEVLKRCPTQRQELQRSQRRTKNPKGKKEIQDAKDYVGNLSNPRMGALRSGRYPTQGQKKISSKQERVDERQEELKWERSEIRVCTKISHSMPQLVRMLCSEFQRVRQQTVSFAQGTLMLA